MKATFETHHQEDFYESIKMWWMPATYVCLFWFFYGVLFHFVLQYQCLADMPWWLMVLYVIGMVLYLPALFFHAFAIIVLVMPVVLGVEWLLHGCKWSDEPWSGF